MGKFKVTLTGTLVYNSITAKNEDEAYEKAMEMAESCMVHDILDDGNVEEIKEEK